MVLISSARSGFSPPSLSAAASMLRLASVEFAWVLVLLRFDLSPSELGVIREGKLQTSATVVCDRSLATEGIYGEGEFSMKVLKKFEAGLDIVLVGVGAVLRFGLSS
ncbi:unnamed protein product [Microthlaspi erraticum]|uniref:Uncharacterized protein n=1 Tax=Microthlaspi erraticum TaxID=1685480 RepID=A0A6D2IM77_9BRAS|nr:unnamed protein product [Microthlaspi erraticum]CAA7050403.1 unnamed protein product [Microthlaspi erraticum]